MNIYSKGKGGVLEVKRIDKQKTNKEPMVNMFAQRRFLSEKFTPTVYDVFLPSLLTQFLA